MHFAEWFSNAVLVGVALICAAHFREARREALACAILIGVDWLEYVLSWSPYSIYAALKAIGFPLGYTDIWMLTDAIIAAIVVSIGLDRRWAALLWCSLAAQVATHSAYQAEWLGFDRYSRVLDWFFWAQIACFVWEGGPGVWDRCSRLAHRVRYGLGSPSTAHRSSSARR